MRFFFLLVTFLLVAGLLGAACGDSATTTAAPSAANATTKPPATTQAPTTTEATTTTSAISDEQLAAAAAVGDISAGEELFNKKLDGVPHSLSCSSCHTLDGTERPDGPTLAGISAVAADRVEGMSDVDYLRQSIVDPYALQVGDEWSIPMPYQYPDVLSQDQVNNLIAFLLTR